MWKIISVYRGLGEVEWSMVACVAVIVVLAIDGFFQMRWLRVRVNALGVVARRFLRPPLSMNWDQVTEARQGKMGMNEVLTLQSSAGRLVLGMPALGKAQYEQMISLVREGLMSGNPSVLDVSGKLQPLVGKKIFWTSLWHTLPWIVIYAVFATIALSLLDNVPDRKDMGLILYCGIRHERDVEKARHYLDGETLESLEWIQWHPDVVARKRPGLFFTKDEAPYDLIWGDLIGCLKAGGLLEHVPGTAEEWLSKSGDRSSNVMLRRLEQ